MVKRRVQAACRLLREQGNMSVEEVSLETGFTSLSAFQDVFKRIMGQTPNAYREQMMQSK